MIGVIVYWQEEATQGLGAKKLLSFYRLTAKAFGCTNLITIGKDTPECSDQEITYEKFSSLKEAAKAYSKAKIVVLSANRGAPLQEFKHPQDDVFYVIGNDYGDVPEGDLVGLKSRTSFINIPTPRSIPLWAHVALGIVLYGRQ